VIQSFEQADYYMRNLSGGGYLYRGQVNVLMDQVNSLVRGFRSQQGRGPGRFGKRRLELEELSAELKKGRKEFEAFKRSLETKTLHQEVKDALGEKSGYLGNILSDNTNASKQMGVLSNASSNGKFSRRNSASQGSSNHFSDTGLGNGGSRRGSLAPLDEKSVGHRFDRALKQGYSSSNSNFSNGINNGGSINSNINNGINNGGSRRDSVNQGDRNNYSRPGVGSGSGSQGNRDNMARGGVGNGSSSDIGFRSSNGFGSSQHSSRPRAYVQVHRRFSTQSEPRGGVGAQTRSSEIAVAGQSDLRNRRKRTLVVYGYTTSAGEITTRKIQSDILNRVEVVAQIKNVATRTPRFSTNNSVVVLVELDSESSVHMALRRSGRLKGSGLYLRADRSLEERKRDREQRLDGQIIPPGSRRDVATGRFEYSQEEVRKARLVMQSLQSAGNGQWNPAPTRV